MSHNYINVSFKIILISIACQIIIFLFKRPQPPIDYQMSIDRSSSSLNMINGKLYSNNFNYTSTNGSLATSSISSQFESSETVNQSLLRRDNEIERLKMRILLLQQQSPASDAVPSNLGHNGEMKLREIELNTAMLRMEMKTNASKDAHIAKLENLLK